MLQAIRDRSTGWVAWIIIIMITIPFTLWGLNEYTQDGPKRFAASVNDTEISLPAYSRALGDYKQRIQQMFGKSYSPDEQMLKQMKKTTLDGLVSEEVMLQAAYEHGMRVSDNQVKRRISTFEFLRTDGKFDNDRYQTFLKYRGKSAAQFEQEFRNNLLAQQLASSIEDSIFVTDHAAKSLAKLKNQTRRIEYIEITKESVEQEYDFSETEITTYYQQHKKNYRDPASAVFQYIELDMETIAAKVQVDETTLQQSYDDTKDRYTKAERRQASHILLESSSRANDPEQKRVHTKAVEIKKMLTPENFSAMAKTHSTDEGSKEGGGQLGYFDRGYMVKAFEDKAFSMQKGEISEPIKSPFGYHIIYLTDVEEERIKSFAEAKEEVEKTYRLRQAENQYYDLAEELANLAHEHPDNLNKIATDLTLKINTSENINEEGSEIGLFSEPKILKEGFSHEIIAGVNSEVIELQNNKLVVLRMKTYVPAKPIKITKVKEDIVKQLTRTKNNLRLKEKADSLIKQLKEGMSIQFVANEEKLKVESLGLIDRTHGIDPIVIKKVFKMPYPAVEKIEYASFSMQNGNTAIVALLEVKNGEVSEENLASLKKSIIDTYNSDIVSFRKDIQSRAKVVVNYDQL